MNEILNNVKNINLEKGLNLEIKEDIENYKNIAQKAILSGVEYAFKAYDLKDESKDVIKSVKNVFKEDSYKNLIGVAIDSSLKLGLEIIKKKFPILRGLDMIKEVSLKGGLPNFLASTIDIASSKVLKSSLMNDGIKRFLNDIKGYLKSASFIQKLETGINRLKNKVNQFKELSDSWYKSYEKFDLDEINKFANMIKKNVCYVRNYNNCVKENNIIQNMTKLINNKMDKLSNAQLEACANL